MDTRRDKDKEFDKAQAMDRLSQDDKDKMSLIRMMMAKEKDKMKEIRRTPSDRAMDDKAKDKDEEYRDIKKENIDYRLDPYDDKEEVEGMIIKLIVGKRGVDADIAKSFIDTHYTDIINADGPDSILDEFDEFMSVNTEYVREEDGKNLNPGNPPANFKSPNEEGDEAVGRESASGAFEEVMNWRGETLREQFKRLMK
tara:strand:- start:42 stop:635 length:594 start_codon:yes stop_codon:yes gene_type:complete